MIRRLLLILGAAIGLLFVGTAMASANDGSHHHKSGQHQTVKQKHRADKVKGQHPPNHHKHGVKHDQNKPGKPGCICKPKPTPPPGGWPCMHTHSCKPHKPHCGPGKPPHHHKPPVKPPHHHKPPHVTPPPEKPPVHVVKHHKPPVHLTHTVTTASTVPSLPRTGGFASQLLLLGLLALMAGSLLVCVPRKNGGRIPKGS